MSHDDTTLSVRYVLNLLAAAEQRGLSRASVCAGADVAVPVTDDPSLRYRTAEYLRLWRVVMERLGDPAFPLAVTTLATPETSDVLGFAFITSANMGEGLERISRHLLIMTDGARWVLERSEQNARLALVRRDDFVAEHQFADEFALGHIVYWGRILTRLDWAPLEVRFRHPPPSASTHDVFADHFRAPLVFGCARSELVLPPELLAAPLPKANSAIAAFFDRHIEEHLARRYPGRSFVQEVRTAIIEAFSCQQVELAAVAKRLGTSARTLSRRLASEGVNFKRLVDDLRSELAQQYLEDRRLSLGEIAFILGYAEPSAFHHAFRRWTGLTPSQFRASRRGAPGSVQTRSA